jgi:protein SCO1/2
VNARVLIAMFLVSVFALGAIVLAAAREREEAGAEPGVGFKGAVMPEGLRAPDFNLRDENGRRITMKEFRGRPVIVTYLYTSCEETCPVQAQIVRQALDELGRDVPAIAIAVDPPNDTPESARAFLAEQRVTGRLRFVLGTRAELRRLWDGYYIQPQLEEAEHQARFTLVDPRGFQRVGYPASQADARSIAHDLRLLEDE